MDKPKKYQASGSDQTFQFEGSQPVEPAPVRVLADIVEILEYVSRGRGFVDVEPYPDAKARRVLGAIRG